MIEKLLRFFFRRTVNRIENNAVRSTCSMFIGEIITALPKPLAKRFTANYYAEQTAKKIVNLMEIWKKGCDVPGDSLSMADAIMIHGTTGLNLSFRTVERKPRVKPIAQQEMKEEVKP